MIHKALGFKSFSDFLRSRGDLVDLDETSTTRMVRLHKNDAASWPDIAIHRPHGHERTWRKSPFRVVLAQNDLRRWFRAPGTATWCVDRT